MVRIGFGTDSHEFEKTKQKPLILGGVKISNTDGMKANSDGDVILHSLFNAISQACGGHSLGYYADPLFKKGVTDSKEYLKVSIIEVTGFNKAAVLYVPDNSDNGYTIGVAYIHN